MHTQAAGSAQHQRSTKRTKLLVRFAAWSTRILTLFSFVVFVLALKNIFHPFFGYLMFVTIICSVISPLNCYCCCYSKGAKNTTSGRYCVYVWLFICNMLYLMMFGYSWFFMTLARKAFSNNSDPSNFEAASIIIMIITIFLSILNLYTFCISYKYGCCFMDMVDRNHSQQNVEAAVVMNQQISTSGGQANDSQFTNVPMDAQHTASSGGIRYSQCQSYLAGHDYMAAPHQQCIGVTADSEGPSFQPTMTMTSGQFVSPPPYTLYDPNVIS
ncbi:uncharacterized protein LOC128224892 isoform X1 [Mya arenaria]|uniref:uncharacterized protein LOC128224892 isoform X1 n=2 Tax=Mya arenaria TaxID=6604 RepID=UPI0022E91D84|nr:uncharacterized protein LOC128224892 isoform X1 [Mya arenaria]